MDGTLGTWVSVPELSVSSGVTLGKWLSLSNVKSLVLPYVPNCRIGVNDAHVFVSFLF